jgi:ribonuclease HII
MDQIARVGIDEVGRGALAGPAVVGAVTLVGINAPRLIKELVQICAIKKLKDSKKLSIDQRERVFLFLEKRIIWSVGRVEAAEIDRLGLTMGIYLAADRAFTALEGQGVIIAEVTADAGLRHPYEKLVPSTMTVRGDETILEIMLASIIAKVWRDRYMRELDVVLPGYCFAQHVGYGTKIHQEAIKRLGISVQHRRLFLHNLMSKSGTIYSYDNNLCGSSRAD